MVTPPTIVVGPIPNPVGGVSSFITRLLYRHLDAIDCVMDPYPGRKALPTGVPAKTHVRTAGKIGLYLGLSSRVLLRNIRRIFFNFSTPSSLIFIALLPKARNDTWCLMLHHGELKIPRNVIARAVMQASLRRFDTVYSISPKQDCFYEKMCREGAHLCRTTSYIKPVPAEPNADAMMLLEECRTRFDSIYIMSGGPSAIYNYRPAVEMFLNDPPKASCLHIFLYSKGAELEWLLSLPQRSDRIFVHYGKDEAFFQTFLRGSDVLLRLNLVDSVGFVVRDAVEFGVKVIASDVCPRPESAVVFNPFESDLRDVIKQLSLPVTTPVSGERSIEFILG